MPLQFACMALQHRIVASPFYRPNNISAFQKMHTRCNSQCGRHAPPEAPFLSLFLEGGRGGRGACRMKRQGCLLYSSLFLSFSIDPMKTYHSLPCGEIRACVPALGQSRGRGEGRGTVLGKLWHSSSTRCKTTAFGHGYL